MTLADEIAYHLTLATVTSLAVILTIFVSVALWDWFRDWFSRRK